MSNQQSQFTNKMSIYIILHPCFPWVFHGFPLVQSLVLPWPLPMPCACGGGAMACASVSAAMRTSSSMRAATSGVSSTWRRVGNGVDWWGWGWDNSCGDDLWQLSLRLTLGFLLSKGVLDDVFDVLSTLIHLLYLVWKWTVNSGSLYKYIYVCVCDLSLSIVGAIQATSWC